MTVRELLREGERALADAGIREASVDARLLLLSALKTDLKDFLLHEEDAPESFGSGAAERYRALISRRASREPLQYITGEQDFCGISIQVDPRVLIPRQDTEILVEEVLRTADRGRLLDLCTGSGCIAAALGKLGHFSSVTAADNSRAALLVAEGNLRRAGVRAELLLSDLYGALRGRRFDVITANPPYIETGVIASLSPEVRDFEPVSALDGSGDGLAFYRRLAAESPAHLNCGGRVFFEIGSGQREQVLALLSRAGFQELSCRKDLSGLDRVVTARWNFMERKGGGCSRV